MRGLLLLWACNVALASTGSSIGDLTEQAPTAATEQIILPRMLFRKRQGSNSRSPSPAKKRANRSGLKKSTSVPVSLKDFQNLPDSAFPPDKLTMALAENPPSPIEPKLSEKRKLLRRPTEKAQPDMSDSPKSGFSTYRHMDEDYWSNPTDMKAVRSKLEKWVPSTKPRRRYTDRHSDSETPSPPKPPYSRG
nr:PREDICTED: uncharacterized protein LOC109039765 [Bemisia tabaci]